MSSQQESSTRAIVGEESRPTGYGATDNINDDEESIVSDDISNVSYTRLLQRYVIIVSLGSILTLVALILLLVLLFPKHWDSGSTFLRLYLAPFGVATVAWTASHAFKVPLWKGCTHLGQGVEEITTILHVILTDLLRLGILLLLKPFGTKQGNDSRDIDVDFFYISCWAALGWATAEVTVGIVQGYEQLAAYRDLYEQPKVYFLGQEEVESPVQMRASERERMRTSDVHYPEDTISPFHSEEDWEDWMRLKYVTELEKLYGIAIPDIPVFISVLQRIDSIFVSLGLTLLLSSSLLSEPSHNVARIILTFFITVLIHFLLSFLWTRGVLPRIGVHSAAYVALMVSIGCIWAGLWRWGLLE